MIVKKELPMYFYRTEYDIKIDLLQNDMLWENSYYLTRWPDTRLIPCKTLNLSHKTLSKHQTSLVKTGVL